MPSSATYKLEIKSANAAGFTLNSVCSAPRSCTPLDLTAAIENVLLEAQGEEPPADVRACAQYLLTEFFALAHRTGLYNRQKLLWDALGKVTVVEVERLQQGLFTKTDLPYYDLLYKDVKGNVAVFGHLIEHEAFSTALLESEKKQRDYLKNLLHRVEKAHASKGPVGGVVLFCPAPFPNNFLTEVVKLTGGDDPVGRYESRLPEPLGIAIDLIEFAQQASRVNVRLVHPTLTVASKGGKPQAAETKE